MTPAQRLRLQSIVEEIAFQGLSHEGALQFGKFSVNIKKPGVNLYMHITCYAKGVKKRIRIVVNKKTVSRGATMSYVDALDALTLIQDAKYNDILKSRILCEMLRETNFSDVPMHTMANTPRFTLAYMRDQNFVPTVFVVMNGTDTQLCIDASKKEIRDMNIHIGDAIEAMTLVQKTFRYI